MYCGKEWVLELGGVGGKEDRGRCVGVRKRCWKDYKVSGQGRYVLEDGRGLG